VLAQLVIVFFGGGGTCIFDDFIESLKHTLFKLEGLEMC